MVLFILKTHYYLSNPIGSQKYYVVAFRACLLILMCDNTDLLHFPHLPVILVWD